MGKFQEKWLSKFNSKRFPGDLAGDFINRIPYPDAELSVNKENMEEALARQGFSENNLDGHVWWDQ